VNSQPQDRGRVSMQLPKLPQPGAGNVLETLSEVDIDVD
jgi:hypothetical protein